MEDLSVKNISLQVSQSLLRTQVYEYLSRELKKEILKPGMFVSMNQIMRHLNISRTPLRDALPLGQSESGLPIGVQFAAGFGEEARLINIASAFEEAMPWRDRVPPVHAGG